MINFKQKNYKFFEIFLFVMFIFIVINRFLLIFDFSQDLGGIEQVFIYYILSVVNNIPLYTDFNRPPFSNIQYMPFYFESLGSLISLIRDNVTVSFTTKFLRGFNILLHLLTAFIAMKSYKELFNYNRTTLILIFVFVFSSFTSIHYAVRPDSLKTFFLLVSFYSLLKVSNVKGFSIFYLFTFIASAILAALTKQDAIIIISFFILYGLFFDIFLKWFKIAFAIALSLLIIIIYFYIYYGDFFYKNVFLANQFHFSTEYFYFAIFLKWFHWFILILITSAIYFYKSKSQLSIQKYLILFFVPFIIVFFLSFRWGAGVNYYQDLLIVFIVFGIGFLLNHIDSIKMDYKYLFLILIFTTFFLLDVKSGYIKIYNTETNKRNNQIAEESQQIVNKLKDGNTNPFYVYTYEKLICNLLSENCLFPAYETDNPQFLAYTQFYGNLTTKKSLPDLPTFRFQSSGTLFELAKKDRKVYAIMSKEVMFLEFSDFEYINFEKIDSTKMFYLYVAK